MRHVPGTRSARSFFRDPRSFVARHGNGQALLHLRSGTGGFVLVRDPEEIWRVLVTDGGSFRPGKWKRRARRFVGPTLNTLHGEEHRERRRALTPALARPRIEACAGALEARAADGGRGARARAGAATAGVARPAVARDGGRRAAVDRPRRPRSGAGRGPRRDHGLPPAAGPAAAGHPPRPRAGARRGRRGGDRLRPAGSGGAGDDLVACLLAADLPDATVRGELIGFLLAAVDEPPSALEAASTCWRATPGARARLRRRWTPRSRGAPAPGRSLRLPWLDAVLRETLRLFPPARHIDRCPVHDVQLAGEHVPAGENVVLSPLVTHGEPALHDRPLDFDPERWMGDNASGKGSYFPFGAGVHTCIGEPLARAVMFLVLAAVAQRRRVEVEPGAGPPPPRGLRSGDGDRQVSRRLDLLDALIYADCFDCALTLEEVWRYGQ